MKRKILVVHPQLVPRGGSEACAVWIIQALKNEYDVSLLSMGKIELDKLNQFYGTSIKNGDIKIISVPTPRLFKNRFDVLRSYRISRYCKRISPKFDIVISAYNVMDFGKKGIQFIGDFSFDDDLRREYDTAEDINKRWFYKRSFLRGLYLWLGRIISGTKKNNWKKNITVANSRWVEKIIKDSYNIRTALIYPPVINKNFEGVTWAEKIEDFVFLGRISPEKGLENVIEILREVRKEKPDLRLHIIGSIDNSPYSKKIKKICEVNNWCILEGSMCGQDKLRFIEKYKYGISGRPNEPFGISIAEMVNGGCIVFVPNGGGQTEIVNNEKLIYKDRTDAVTKIEKVLLSEDIQEDITKKLSYQKNKFSTDNFMVEVKKIINNLN